MLLFVEPLLPSSIIHPNMLLGRSSELPSGCMFVECSRVQCLFHLCRMVSHLVNKLEVHQEKVKPPITSRLAYVFETKC
jgi:hypothetical protein